MIRHNIGGAISDNTKIDESLHRKKTTKRTNKKTT